MDYPRNVFLLPTFNCVLSLCHVFSAPAVECCWKMNQFDLMQRTYTFGGGVDFVPFNWTQVSYNVLGSDALDV